MSSLCPHCGKDHPDGRCPEAAMLATQLALSQQTLLSTDGSVPLGVVEKLRETGELPSGTMVGEYQVVRKVGVGGMGVVYQGVHPLIGRKVAIKVINAQTLAAHGGGQRFLQEARAASIIRHRNIVDVFAFGQLKDGRSYLVMEFLDGESLADFLRHHGPLSFSEALPILDGVLAGLRAAHDKGIVHRDLKPENIWILPPDEPREDPRTVEAAQVKLLDFGLAKLTEIDPDVPPDARLTRMGVPMGTPAFMSPEQCRGVGEIDHRTDLYSFGIVMYEMFSRDLPFSGATLIEVLHLQMTETPPSLVERVGMPADLDAVIARALQKEPDRRFQSAAELRAALLACDEALEWTPRKDKPAAYADTMQPTLIGEIHVAAGMAKVPSLAIAGFRAEAELDGSTLQLTLRGELDVDAGRILGEYLGVLTHAMQDSARRVVLDVVEVAYLASDGVACLAEWLSLLREMRAEGFAPSTLRYSDAVQWQRTSVPPLQRVDPALMIESVD